MQVAFFKEEGALHTVASREFPLAQHTPAG